MSVSLSKKQTISLSKEGGGSLTSVFMGLGWDAAAPPKKAGFFGSLMGGGGSSSGGSIDLDASVLLIDGNKNVVDSIYFGKKDSSDGSIRHSGDNLTGDGDGDDEVINVDLTKLAPSVQYLVFTVNSLRGQTFNEVDNAVARLVDKTTKKEICRFVLAEKGAHTGVIMASMARTGSGWSMTAHGIPCAGRTVRDIAQDAIRVL